MKRELAIEFCRVTEAAALAASKWIGRGDKNSADGAAVAGMRHVLSEIEIAGEIVIGEGEIDEAPMLYIGEKVGTGQGDAVDIAVDPLEGTRMTAVGQGNAIAVLAVGPAGSFLKAPDMYMEKLIVGPGAKDAIDISLDIETNIKNIAKALNKPITEVVVAVLDKPRHKGVISKLQAMGVRVYAFHDGDVVMSIMTCIAKNPVDVLYGIGGAPEGVISAAVITALGGYMEARLVLKDEAKGYTPENIAIANEERQRCVKMGVEPNKRLVLKDLVMSDDIVFTATGVTSGDLLNGVVRDGNIAETETLLVRGKSRTVRVVKATHQMDYKNDYVTDLYR